MNTLQSHGNLQSLTDLINGANSNSVLIQIQETGNFECSWHQKSIH